MTPLTLTTVTPVYSGARYLPELVEALARVRTDWELTKFPVRIQEAIFVTDDPIDSSVEVLLELERQHPWVRVVQLSRNFGQHAATVAGILQSTGDWVATLDEDLQHHPRFLVQLLREAVAGSFDIVYAHPTQGVHQSIFRDYSSRTYKRLLAFLSGDQNITQINSYRLLRGGLARAAAAICSHQTFFDIALFWFSKRVGSVRLHLIDKRYLEEKRSGYGFMKLLSHARRMMVTAQSKSIRAGGLVGLAALCTGVVLGLKAIGEKLFFPEKVPVAGWTSLFVAGTFLGGTIAFLVGIALEYLGVLVLSAQGKPVFYVIDRAADATVRDHFLRHPGFEPHAAA